MVAAPKSLRALILDDDVGVRSSVASVLEAAGHCVHLAKDRDEALDIVRFHAVDFGIVDVNVRRDDGLIIVGTLRAVVHRLPVIVMSGALTPDVLGRAERLGAHECLEKPLDMWRLRLAVRRLVEAERLGW